MQTVSVLHRLLKICSMHRVRCGTFGVEVYPFLHYFPVFECPPFGSYLAYLLVEEFALPLLFYSLSRIPKQAHSHLSLSKGLHTPTRSCVSLFSFRCPDTPLHVLFCGRTDVFIYFSRKKVFRSRVPPVIGCFGVGFVAHELVLATAVYATINVGRAYVGLQH